MKAVRLSLLCYCALAVVALVLWGVIQVVHHQRLGSQLDQIAITLPGQKDALRDASRALKGLEATQRQGRAEFSGPEAVDISYQVQQAMVTYEQVRAAYDATARLVGDLEGEQQQALLRLGPIIALTLLHLFGVFLLFRPREQRR